MCRLSEIIAVIIVLTNSNYKKPTEFRLWVGISVIADDAVWPRKRSTLSGVFRADCRDVMRRLLKCLICSKNTSVQGCFHR